MPGDLPAANPEVELNEVSCGAQGDVFMYFVSAEAHASLPLSLDEGGGNRISSDVDLVGLASKRSPSISARVSS